MHLLIVDDGQYVVEYLKHLLNWAKFGVHRIETTTNPTEAGCCWTATGSTS